MTDQNQEQRRKPRISKRFIQDPLIKRFDPTAPDAADFELKPDPPETESSPVKKSKKKKSKSEDQTRFYEVTTDLKDVFKKQDGQTDQKDPGFSLLKHLGLDEPQPQSFVQTDRSIGRHMKFTDHESREDEPPKNLFREKFFFDGPTDRRLTKDPFFDPVVINELTKPSNLNDMKKKMFESISKKKRFFMRQQEMVQRVKNKRNVKTKS